MARSLSCVVAIAAFGFAAPALAADYEMYPELRPSYPDSWENGEDNPLRFEAGLRYWYSWGNQSMSFAPTTLETEDQTHMLEVHAKVEDLGTQTYVKTQAGLGINTTGEYTMSPAGVAEIGENSVIGHVGGDFGWLPWGQMKGGVAAGALVGYQYWQDSPDLGRGNFVTGVSGGVPTGYDSAPGELNINALRLGVKAQADFDMFDIQAEVAAVPYAYIAGVLGAHELDGVPIAPDTLLYKSSSTSLSGHGYGAMGELMVGFHPTENLTLRIGGRAWYIEGALDATFDSYTVTDDGVNPPTTSQQSFIQTSEWASILRYGALFELTGRF